MAPRKFAQPVGRNTTKKEQSQPNDIRIIFSQEKDVLFFKTRAFSAADPGTPLLINAVKGIKKDYPNLRSRLSVWARDYSNMTNIPEMHEVFRHVSGDTVLQYLYVHQSRGSIPELLNKGPQFIPLARDLGINGLPPLLFLKDDSPQPRYLVFIPQLPKDLVEQHKINLDTIANVLRNKTSEGSHLMVVAQNTPEGGLAPYLNGAHHSLLKTGNVQSKCEMPELSLGYYVRGNESMEYKDVEFEELAKYAGVASNNAGARQAIETGFLNLGQGSLVSEGCSPPSDHPQAAPRVLKSTEYFEQQMVDIEDKITALWESAKKLENQGTAPNPGYGLLINSNYLPMLYAIKKLDSTVLLRRFYSGDTYEDIASKFREAFKESSKDQDGKDIGFEDKGVARAKRFLKLLAQNLKDYITKSTTINAIEQQKIQNLIKSVESQISNIESIPEDEYEAMLKEQKRIAEFMAKVDQGIQDLGKVIQKEKPLIEEGKHTINKAFSNLNTEFLKIPTVEEFQDMSHKAIDALLGDAADLLYPGFPKEVSVLRLEGEQEEIHNLFLEQLHYQFNIYDYGKGCNTKDALPQGDIVPLKLEDKNICVQCNPNITHHIIFPKYNNNDNLADVMVLNDVSNRKVLISFQGTDGKGKKIIFDYSQLANVTAVIAQDELGNFLTLNAIDRSVSVGKPNNSTKVVPINVPSSTSSQGNSTGQPSLSPFWNGSLPSIASNSTGRPITADTANSSQTGLGLGLGFGVVGTGLLALLIKRIYDRWYKKSPEYQPHTDQQEELSVMSIPDTQTFGSKKEPDTPSIDGISNEDQYSLESSHSTNDIYIENKKFVLPVQV